MFIEASQSLVGGTTLTVFVAACGGETELGSSNRGSGSHTESTTVENAVIVPAYLPGSCAIQLEAGALMRFTVTNNRPTAAERLLEVSSDAARKARIITNVDIPPQSTVGFGEPSAEAVDPGGRAAAVRLNELDPGLRPGMPTPVTFHFQHADDTTMPVPVEACPTQAQ
ncbi:hypothetical protein [Mycolicibacterium baixiangningiae]|uniref:hypothetical protein n=1 Tax=Mycolicibacterium baixiangningiae TaxID=2761578 RepID=UPI0018D15417|nr:hypothetical protein [Mycolicibacterium baixiangningiae]